MIKKLFAVLALGAIILGAQPVSTKAEERISREVRHELVMLPYYGVFDNLTVPC